MDKLEHVMMVMEFCDDLQHRGWVRGVTTNTLEPSVAVY